MATKAEKVIAATLGWDESEVDDYRYQSTRTEKPIYSIGDTMFAVGPNPPKDYDNWVKHKDQFFATQSKTVLWIRKTGE